MTETVSYSTPLSKGAVFGLAAMMAGWPIFRPAVPGWDRIGDCLATLLAIVGAGFAHQLRETVAVRSPSGENERLRLRWSYVAAVAGGLLGLAAIVAFTAAAVGAASARYWLIAGSLIVIASVTREIADRLYEPFVIRSAPNVR